MLQVRIKSICQRPINFCAFLIVALMVSTTMALAQGAVRAWGDDAQSQLGDPSTPDAATPAPIPGLSRVVQVAGGYAHSIARKSDGSVWAWGNNVFGQTGRADLNPSRTPVRVEGLPLIVAIAAGGGHNLALDSSGNVWAWGINYVGELGNGSTMNSYTPAPVSGLSGVVAISAGGSFSVALTADGQIYAWGYNNYGQLGQGTRDGRPHPLPLLITTLSDGTAIAAGENHLLVLRSSGEVYGWGRNANWLLGGGAATDSLLPVRFEGVSNITWVSAGSDRSMALQSNGDLWGRGSYFENLIAQSAIEEVVAVAASGSHTLAVRADGTVWEQGSIASNPLDTDNNIHYNFVPVNGINSVASVGAGRSHSLAVRQDGTVWSWGSNDYEQLGRLTTRTHPVLTVGVGYALRLAAGFGHAISIQSDGTVSTWGQNNYGQLGPGYQSPSANPSSVNGLSGIADVAAGGFHSLAIQSDGSVWAWGANFAGQLGTGEDTPQFMPIPLALTDVAAVAAGNSHSLFLKTDGTVWACGSNDYGQVGVGDHSNQLTPVQVQGLENVIAIAAGGEYSLALKSDGTVWAWGQNYLGQLGDVPLDSSDSPVQVVGLMGITRIAASSCGGHSLALCSDGTVWAWGSNRRGQLGIGSMPGISWVPVQVQGILNPTAIAAGGDSSLAIQADGTVVAWGSNARGQLGDGTYLDHPFPMPVSPLVNATAIAAGSAFMLVVAEVPPARSEPTELTLVESLPTSITMQWRDNTPDETEFVLEQQVEDVFTQAATFGPNDANLTASMSGTVGGLQPETTYTFRVLARVDGSLTPPSNTLTVTTAGVAAPTNFTAVAGSATQVSLNWQDHSQVETGYRLTRFRMQDGAPVEEVTRILDANSTAAEETGLLPDTDYSYELTAVTDSETSDTVTVSVHTPAEPVEPVRTVAGHITLDSVVSDAPEQTVTLTFSPNDGTASFTRTVQIGSEGAYSLNNLPAKSYTIHIKGEKWLAKNLSVDVTESDASDASTLLPGGDANNDNSVDALDLAMLITAFNSTPEETDNWNSAADFNLDGSADALDLAILITNFNAVGDL